MKNSSTNRILIVLSGDLKRHLKKIVQPYYVIQSMESIEYTIYTSLIIT